MSVQPQTYLGSEHKRRRLSSTQSTESNSSAAPPLFSFTGVAPSLVTSVRSKDEMAHEHVKGPPVEIFLFTCLQQSADEAVWEAGAEFPGSAGLVSVIAKLAFSDVRLGRLIHENSIYSFLSRDPLVQLSIPTCYGVYYCYLEGQGTYVGLLLTSLVPGTTANQLNYTELMATMYVHVALGMFCSWILLNSPSIRDAVNALHVEGVIHGDIAGRNIIVHEKQPTLIDFGNASITTDFKSRQKDLDVVERLLSE